MKKILYLRRGIDFLAFSSLKMLCEQTVSALLPAPPFPSAECMQLNRVARGAGRDFVRAEEGAARALALEQALLPHGTRRCERQTELASGGGWCRDVYRAWTVVWWDCGIASEWLGVALGESEGGSIR